MQITRLMKPARWMSCISTTNVFPARSWQRTSRIESFAPVISGSCSIGRYSIPSMVWSPIRSSRSLSSPRRMSGCLAKIRRKTKSFFRSAKAMSSSYRRRGPGASDGAQRGSSGLDGGGECLKNGGLVVQTCVKAARLASGLILSLFLLPSCSSSHLATRTLITRTRSFGYDQRADRSSPIASKGTARTTSAPPWRMGSPQRPSAPSV